MRPLASDETKARRRAMIEGLSWQDKVTVIVWCMRERNKAHEKLLAEVLAMGKSVANPS